jgi:tetratricopeptide (TPR) repeat protein
MGLLSNLFGSARARAQSLYERGMLKAKKEDYAGAIEDYTALLRVDKAPEDIKAMALFNRGLAFSVTKDIVKAREDLQSVITMHGAPTNVVSAAREKLERIKRREKDE